MVEFLQSTVKPTVLVFVVTCMVMVGLELRMRDVVAPLRRTRLVLLALGVNLLVAPAVAYTLVQLTHLDRPYAVGLILLGAAAGAPVLPKLAELAKGDRALAVALMLVLTAGNVVVMPLVLPLLIPGLSADPWPILYPLLTTMLLPLAVGMLVRNRSERWAGTLRPVLGAVSNVSMLVAVVLLVGLNFGALLGTFGSGAVAVAVLYGVLNIGIGYAAGGPSLATRSVVALGTGQRNFAAALIVTARSFADEPGVVVMLLAATLAELVVLLLAARWFGRRATAAAWVGPIPEEVSR